VDRLKWPIVYIATSVQGRYTQLLPTNNFCWKYLESWFEVGTRIYIERKVVLLPAN